MMDNVQYHNIVIKNVKLIIMSYVYPYKLSTHIY
jgi:hypothetical protein